VLNGVVGFLTDMLAVTFAVLKTVVSEIRTQYLEIILLHLLFGIVYLHVAFEFRTLELCYLFWYMKCNYFSIIMVMGCSNISNKFVIEKIQTSSPDTR
jgi:hypothetical protein